MYCIKVRWFDDKTFAVEIGNGAPNYACWNLSKKNATAFLRLTIRVFVNFLKSERYNVACIVILPFFMFQYSNISDYVIQLVHLYEKH